MARLNSAKKLIPEDFDEKDRDLVTKLSDVLNPFIYGVFTAISKQINLTENIKNQVFIIDLLAGQSTVNLKWTLNEKPQALLIGNLIKSDKSFVSQPASVSWSINGEKLSVAVVGLASATAHTITLVGLV
jgi:hypothetical protein